MRTELARWRQSMVLRRKAEIVGDVVGAFESNTAAVFLATAPVGERSVLHILFGFIVTTLVLMCVVNLDIVVTGTGLITPVNGQVYISPYSTGVIKKVNVKAGDFVKKGDSLAVLDPTFAQADLLQLQEHLESDEATVAREEAEVADRPFVYSESAHYWALQGGIWLKRQGEYRSNVDNFEGQIRSTEALVAQYEGDVRQYTQRLKLAVDVEKIYQPMLDKGYVSQLQLMSATDSRTEMARLLADAQNLVESNRQTAIALIAQRDAYIHKWHSDTGAQLILDRNDLDITRDSLTKAQKTKDLTSLDAPEDAIVLKVGKVSIGSVYEGGGVDAATPGTDPLFTLMPLNAPLFADVWVQTLDVGFVKTGQPVELKLDAYRYLEYGTAKGVVKSVSENSFSTDQNGNPISPYFKAHVAITSVNLRNVPKNFRLLPGNTLTGDIIVGKRTIMSYMMEGVMKSTVEAMREP